MPPLQMSNILHSMDCPQRRLVTLNFTTCLINLWEEQLYLPSVIATNFLERGSTWFNRHNSTVPTKLSHSIGIPPTTNSLSASMLSSCELTLRTIAYENGFPFLQSSFWTSMMSPNYGKSPLSSLQQMGFRCFILKLICHHILNLGNWKNLELINELLHCPKNNFPWLSIQDVHPVIWWTSGIVESLSPIRCSK